MTVEIIMGAAGLMTTKEAAEYLGSTENSLRSMRCEGYGPRFHKIGRAVFYMADELDAYAAVVGPSSRTARVGRTLPAKERGASGSTRMRP